MKVRADMSSKAEPRVLRIDDAQTPGVTTIKFNRPAVKNALAPDDLLLASRYLSDCQYDDSVQVVFLTGAGDAFTSGFDLKFLNELGSRERSSALDTATELTTRIVSTPKIVIAAVNGASAGLGNHIALCSDLCIARSDAVFHFTGAVKGIPSMQLGALLLPLTIGLKRAKEILLRGAQISAERAHELGMCNDVVDPDKWTAAIAALGAEFANRSSATMAQNKFQTNQFAFHMLGALKLSTLAGGSQMAAAGEIPTGRVGKKSV